jgi:hypothetical protein
MSRFEGSSLNAEELPCRHTAVRRADHVFDSLHEALALIRG